MSELRLPCDKICIVLLMRIGDVVWGLPIVNALKRDDPSRHITWVVQPVPAPLLQPHPSVDRVVTYERAGGPRALLNLWRQLRPHRFDLVICASHYIKSAIPTLIARAPNKVSYGPDRASDLQWMFSNHNLPPRRSRHMQERYLEFLDFLGLPWQDRIEYGIAITEEERAARAAFFGDTDGRPVAGLVMTSYEPSKNWPVDRFAELAAALRDDFGYRVLLLGGPGRLEQERARRVQKLAGDGITWGLGDDLRRLIYLIDGSSLLVSVDTGPLHIARALETPVIGLYGATDPGRYGPYDAYEDLWIDRYNYLEPAPAAPAPPPEPAERGARMELIQVADVLQKVELARRGHRSRKERV